MKFGLQYLVLFMGTFFTWLFLRKREKNVALMWIMTTFLFYFAVGVQ